MATILQEYGKFIITILISICILGLLFGAYTMLWESASIEEGIGASRKETRDDTTSKPKIHTPELKITAGKNINLLENVVVEDKNDGDLTGQLTIKDLKNQKLLTIQNGRCDYTPEVAGTVYFQYSVKNSRGFRTDHTAMLTIDSKTY